MKVNGYVPHYIFEGGGCSALYTVKLKFDGDIFFGGGGGGDLFRIIYLKGDMFRIFFLM